MKYYPIYKILSLCYVLTFLLLSSVQGQERRKLEEKRKKIEQELEKANSLLKETQKNQENSLQQLTILSSKIKSREELIRTIRFEVNYIEKEIIQKNGVIQSMEKDLNNLKQEYAEMLRNAYKNRSDYQTIMFIVSSADFNQAYKRIKYLQQYSDYRKKQAKVISSTQVSLNSKINDLKRIKKSKLNLIGLENQEKNSLDKEKQDKQQTLNKLKSKEKEIKKEIQKKSNEVAALKKAIEDAIAKEIEAAKKRTLTDKEKKEDLKLMSDFEKNKGAFPWPVNQGIITGRFGKQNHEVLDNIQINNNGIDISVSQGSDALAIFEGVVTKVIVIPNAGKAVLVRHGEYLSVYFQLQEVFVKAGDKINVREKLGSIITNEYGKTELHFELWKGKTILDPSLWLKNAH